MGIDLAVLVGHSLDADVFDLPARLSSPASVRAAALVLHATLKPRWVNLEAPTWSWDPPILSAKTIHEGWRQNEALEMTGASGLTTLYVGRRAGILTEDDSTCNVDGYFIDRLDDLRRDLG